MPLLLIPVALAALLALWVLLMPIALWQRYRRGRARRRAVGWVVRANAWSLLVSTLLFAVTAAVLGVWVGAALPHALLGLAGGSVLGITGLSLTRFERDARGLLYTPNRWLVLALTLVVAVRVGFGLWRAFAAWRSGTPAEWLAQQADLLAIGGLLLGYHLAYAWRLRRRLAAESRY